ncbi:hypothetical protein HO133_003325 [Letharia lupina]|uniref:Uncharacterized protein n=1 Tax=Letharia lupina TaxID=560253 RepID=A0A8H6CBG0_9LECA|nr:uncharacterized protein HO133_003325 [Letharia lupina]KAF6220194.1 hypothetical protein HO133_003325 [Letharia lupina]
MVREASYTKAFVVRFWVSIVSKASQARVELQAYTNRLGDGLVVGFSDGSGGVWRFGVYVPTPLTAIWTLCKAQSTSSYL